MPKINNDADAKKLLKEMKIVKFFDTVKNNLAVFKSKQVGSTLFNFRATKFKTIDDLKEKVMT